MHWRARAFLASGCLAGSLACGEERDVRATMATPLEEGIGGDSTAWFAELAAERGLVFRHDSGARGGFLMPEIMGGGAALLDADGDGDLDAYFVQSGSLMETGGTRGRNCLFANTGGGHFEDRSEGSGAEDPGYGMGVATGDADGDGRVDLFVTNVGANALLLNGGGLRFRAVPEGWGVADPGWGTSAAFFDPDLDGDLDLFVANYLVWSVAGELPCLNAFSQPDYCSPKNYHAPAADLLLENDGRGLFRDRSETSGVASGLGTGLGVIAGDFDGDGREDVYVANDGMVNRLWRNEGGLTFTDVAMRTGCGVDAAGVEKAGMGVAVADLDGDLDLDLLVCNLAGESDSLYYNEDGYFVDRTARSGLAAVSKPFTRFGTGWYDFDHDGRLDLFEVNGRVQAGAGRGSSDPYAEPNSLLRGLEGGRFEPVLPPGGTRDPLVATSRAAAFGDVDGDGAVDVLIVNRDGPAHLLLNLRGKAEALHFDLRGPAGAPALGARVELRLGERSVRGDVRTASSYLAASDARVHLALGGHGAPSEVQVVWPGGEREAFTLSENTRVHVLRAGQGRPPVSLDPPSR